MTDRDPETPEADWLEQSRAAIEEPDDPEATAGGAAPEVTPDANEADVLEQAREVPADDDEARAE